MPNFSNWNRVVSENDIHTTVLLIDFLISLDRVGPSWLSCVGSLIHNMMADYCFTQTGTSTKNMCLCWLADLFVVIYVFLHICPDAMIVQLFAYAYDLYTVLRTRNFGKFHFCIIWTSCSWIPRTTGAQRFKLGSSSTSQHFSKSQHFSTSLFWLYQTLFIRQGLPSRTWYVWKYTNCWWSATR